MGKEADMKAKIYQEAITYVRDNHAQEIDSAYTYFWDEQQPDELMGGVALELGFINFEDWLLCDFKAGDQKESFLAIYARKRESSLAEGEKGVIEKLTGSVLSLYEVSSVSMDKHVKLKDLLMGGELSLREKGLTRGLKKGDIFATRTLKLDGNDTMSGCVYPYKPEQKQSVLSKIDKQFSRYVRNVKKDGTMREYLKDYGDVFNIIWMSFICDQIQADDEPPPAQQ